MDFYNIWSFFPSHLVDSVMVYKNKDILTKEDKEKGSAV